MMKKRWVTIVLVALITGLGFTSYSQANNYPTKPIEIVVPYTAGSSMDVMARVIADEATKYLGQPMFVTNKAGASGIIAGADIINSKADGYKTVVLTNAFFGTTVKTQKMPYDPGDIVPIGNCMQYKMGLFVRSDSPYKTLNDLLEYGKKNPGKLAWGHHGRGISPTMTAMLIFKKAGVQTVEIPHKGSAESVASLLGGQVVASTSNYGPFKPHVESGKLRILVVYSDQRFSDLPDVPTGPELGFPDVGKMSVLIGLYAHKNTPKDAIKVLQDVLKKVCESEEYKKAIKKLGEEPRYGSADLIKKAILDSEEVGVPLLKEIGLYVPQK
ncbi:MAG: tripartite tricarboxylate transporter substrate binding protein [Desulfobacteraceae bacterium]|nr:MAG: tripartite tricarboxylate transporter substrate binding protein [Desulfobacteraceae bacterium]